MKRKKREKIIRLLDPEPRRCFPEAEDCGHWESPRRTGILANDILTNNVYRYAPKSRLIDYADHKLGCLWAEWAKREIVRQMT